jgi:hypothetical protein
MPQDLGGIPRRPCFRFAAEMTGHFTRYKIRPNYEFATQSRRTPLTDGARYGTLDSGTTSVKYTTETAPWCFENSCPRLGRVR